MSVNIIRKDRERAEKEFTREEIDLLVESAKCKKNSLSVWERNIEGPHYRKNEMQDKEKGLEVIMEKLGELT